MSLLVGANLIRLLHRQTTHSNNTVASPFCEGVCYCLFYTLKWFPKGSLGELLCLNYNVQCYHPQRYGRNVMKV